MIRKRKLGNTNLEVSELSMGTAPIGGWPIVVNADDAQETIATAWNKGIRYYDTAGCGLNQNEMLLDLAKIDCFDCFLLAGRYTLLDQTSLDELIPYCKNNNIALVLGGVFNSGVLIDPNSNSYFDYTQLNEDWFENAKKVLVRDPKDFESVDFWLNKAYKLRDECHMFDIPLSKAAIQFPYFNDIVSNVILGMNSKEQVEENYLNDNKKISEDFWKYLKKNSLLDSRSPIE